MVRRDRADRVTCHPHPGEAMATKTVPFTKARAEKIAAEFPTPFHVYDERAIRANARNFRRAFAEFDGFINYFAVKALPNPYILAVLKAEGFGADCSSLPELLLAERVGITGDAIMFTSNDTPAEEFRAARRLGAVINLDDISHIDSLERVCGIPELVSCRYNPGRLKEGNAIIGKPEEAKYGFTRDQLFAGYAQLKAKGATRFGLHTMVA
jgi:diaminopimelate decarboxylase